MKRDTLKEPRLLLHEEKVLLFRCPQFCYGKPFQCRKVVSLDLFVMEGLVFRQLLAHPQEIRSRQEHQLAFFESLDVELRGFFVVEALQVANPPILQSKLEDDLLFIVTNDILSEATAVHVCGCPRDLARLQIMLFLPDNPLLQKTAIEFILIGAESSLIREDVS